MSFLNNIAKLFKKDKSHEVAEKGRGKALDDPSSSGTGMSLGSGPGMKALKAALTMDQDLMQRYSDYENMDDYPELSAGLDIFADDTTITDEIRGKTIWSESKDKVLRDIINDLLHRRLRIEEDIWLAIRTFCKYGNLFAELIVTEKGVVGLSFLPVPTMRRLVSVKGDLIGFLQDLSGQFNVKQEDFKNIGALKVKLEERGIIFFEPWEVVHWRLSSKHVRSIYGWSVFDSARWVWKRLVMLEDTALLYQLTRSPGRYVFYVDTGDLPPEEAMALLRKSKRGYKKRTLVNPSSGNLEFRNNPLNPEEDIWISTRGGQESTRVDTLSGPEWQNTDSLEYFRDKMFTAMKIPRSYYGGDAEAEQGLAQKDVRFARTCMRVQREFRNGVRQIVRVHLAALNIDPDSVEWETRMTAPSSIFELQQIEVMNARAGLIETLAEKFPEDWLLQRVLHLSKEDAKEILDVKYDEDEKRMTNKARIMSEIQKKYPGVEMPVDEPAVQGEDIDIKKKLDKLNEDVKETRQTSSRVLKRIESIGPDIGKNIRRVAN